MRWLQIRRQEAKFYNSIQQTATNAMDCWKKFWKTPTIHDDSRFHGTSDSLHVGLVTLRFYSQARKGVKVVGPSVVDRTVRTAWMYKNVMIDGYRNDDMDGYGRIWYGTRPFHRLYTVYTMNMEHIEAVLLKLRTQLGSALLTTCFLRMSCHQDS